MCVYYASQRQVEDVSHFSHVALPRVNRVSVTERCQQMASLLKGLRSCANADDDARIAEILEAVSATKTVWVIQLIADMVAGRRGDFGVPANNSTINP